MAKRKLGNEMLEKEATRESLELLENNRDFEYQKRRKIEVQYNGNIEDPTIMVSERTNEKCQPPLVKKNMVKNNSSTVIGETANKMLQKNGQDKSTTSEKVKINAPNVANTSKKDEVIDPVMSATQKSNHPLYSTKDCRYVVVPRDIKKDDEVHVKWADGRIFGIVIVEPLKKGTKILVVPPGAAPPGTISRRVSAPRKEQEQQKVEPVLTQRRRKQIIEETFRMTVWPTMMSLGWVESSLGAKTPNGSAGIFCPPPEQTSHVIATDQNKGKIQETSTQQIKGIHNLISQLRAQRQIDSKDDESNQYKDKENQGGVETQKTSQEMHSANKKKFDIWTNEVFKHVFEKFEVLLKAKIGTSSKDHKVTRHSRRMHRWKYIRHSYPNKESRIGRKYQASCLPEVGSYRKEQDSKNNLQMGLMYDKIWDQQWCPDANKKENKFPFNDFTLAPTNIRCWDEEEKQRFLHAIMTSKKNFATVSKNTGRDVSKCLVYYYGHFKGTKDYQRLKKMLQEDAKKYKFEDFNSDYCYKCGQTGRLLCCETCENSVHLTCLTPALREIPEEDWYCEFCIKRGLGGDKKKTITNGSNLSIMTSATKTGEPPNTMRRPRRSPDNEQKSETK